jgi:hypothetical protein
MKFIPELKNRESRQVNLQERGGRIVASGSSLAAKGRLLLLSNLYVAAYTIGFVSMQHTVSCGLFTLLSL